MLEELDEYQAKALVTLARKDSLLLNQLHAATGIATEAGELLDAMKKAIWYNDDIQSIDLEHIDSVNIKEELGDCLWYVAIGVAFLDKDVVPLSSLIIGNTFDDLENETFYDSTLDYIVGVPHGGVGPDSNVFKLAWLLLRDAGDAAKTIWESPTAFINDRKARWQSVLRQIQRLSLHLDVNLAECASINIKKLQTRYESNGGSFDSDAAKNRNLIKERALLEEQK